MTPKPVPPGVDELDRLMRAVTEAHDSGGDVAKAQEELDAFTRSSGLGDGATAAAFADVLEDGDTPDPKAPASTSPMDSPP